MLGGVLYLPYAVDIDGQIMLVYDPVHHEAVETEEDATRKGCTLASERARATIGATRE